MKISIALCTYDGAPFLEEQLASIASQKRLPDELILCDDGSSDQTIEVATRFARSAPFPMAIHEGVGRLGSTRNFERAVRLCTGDLIALADQDDVWLDHKLAEAEAAFVEDDALGCWFTDADLVDDSLRPLGRTLWQSVGFDDRRQQQLRGNARFALMLQRSFVTGATLVFRARFRPLVLPIPSDLHLFIHDRWIATLIAGVASIRFSERSSLLYRQHSAQQIGASNASSPLSELLGRMPRHRQAIDHDLDNALAIEHRLATNPCARPDHVAAKALEERIALLEMRVALPASRLNRIGPVIRASVAGLYARHAAGIASAAKDILL